MKPKIWVRFLLSALLAFCAVDASHALTSLPNGSGESCLPLDSWSFSDKNWLSARGYAPVSFTNLVNVADAGDGNALLLDTTNSSPAYLFYNLVESDGTTNISCSFGSISCWFNPAWSSTNLGGTGPGDWGNLISLGQAGTNGSSWWAWYLSPDGGTVYFSSQTNGGSSSSYLSAPVSFAGSNWYNLVLTYSLTNSAFYTNGVLVTNGTGVTAWAGPDVTFFSIGSDSNGFYQAGGMFDDLKSYNYPLDPGFVQDTFAMYSLFYGLAGMAGSSSGAPAIVSAPSTNANLPVVDFIMGAGFLQSLGTSAPYPTSSNVWLTNWSASIVSSNVMNVHFAVAGGSNGLPYDVFATTAITSPITNATWYWMGQAYRGTNYTLPITNYPAANIFLMLGTPQMESYGLTVAFERLTLKSNSTTGYTYGGLPDAWIALNGLEGNANILNQDPDQDGLNNWQEYLYGTKPLVSEGFGIWVSSPAGVSGMP